MPRRRPHNDSPLDTLHARRTIPARDLLVWSARAGKVEHALLPSCGQPNPVVVGDLVICSLFSPGRVVAIDRQTGKRRWALALRSLGGPHVYDAPGPGLVFGGTSQELLAIDPATGKVRWTFSPYGRKGETIYSSPTVAEGRLFVGDRRGYFHCLNAEDGEPIWRVHTSRAKNNDVNADPVVEGGVVAVATNAALALGYDAPTGRELWRHRLDGPSDGCRSGGGRTALIWTMRSVYLFSVPDGQLLRRWPFPNRYVRHACASGDLVLVVTKNVEGRHRHPGMATDLRAYRGADQLYLQNYPEATGPVLRYDPTTGKVYEATSYGLGILDPVTGNREVVIRFSTGDVADPDVEQTHPPAVAAGVLFAINAKGRIFAIRHP